MPFVRLFEIGNISRDTVGTNFRWRRRRGCNIVSLEVSSSPVVVAGVVDVVVAVVANDVAASAASVASIAWHQLNERLDLLPRRVPPLTLVQARMMLLESVIMIADVVVAAAAPPIANFHRI